MSDPKVDMLNEAANVTAAIVTGNYVGAVLPAKKLLAMLVAYELPPIDAPALDPQDRHDVDVAVDADVSKT